MFLLLTLASQFAVDRQQLFSHLRVGATSQRIVRSEASWPLLSFPECEFPGWTRRCVLCYAMLRAHYERQPAFLWPGRLVTGLRGSVLGREQGQEGISDDLSDARSNTHYTGQPCCFWPVVCCVRWMSIAWTSGSIPMHLRSIAAGSQRKEL